VLGEAVETASQFLFTWRCGGWMWGEQRLRQEIVLGMGGMRALEALDIRPAALLAQITSVPGCAGSSR
jgi:glucan phosphorylase